MVKFGKDFKNSQHNEWKENYVNYKQLKIFIRRSLETIINIEDSSREKEKEKDLSNVEPIASPSFSAFGNTSEPINEELSFPHEKLRVSVRIDEILKKFTEMLDMEIKKIYLFFVHKERELYVQINSHLHIRSNYDTFSIRAIAKELEELNKLSLITFQISKYINDNVTAIKKILKKFDRKFEKFFGEISFQYIHKQLEAKNSHLLYILQFKIIDEVGALLEDLMENLKCRYELKVKSPIDLALPTVEHLINEEDCNIMQVDDFRITDRDLNGYINRNINELSRNIVMIDEDYQRFRDTFKEWNSFLKGALQSKKYSVTKGTSLGGETINFNRETGYGHIDERTGQIELRRLSVDSTLLFSKENGSNIYITLFHTFFYMFSYSIVIPTNKNYVHDLGYDFFYSGFIMAMTPLGAFISIFYSQCWISKSFKQPIVVSSLLIFLGNFLYSLAKPCESLVLMGVGRFLLGLGANRVANRGYLLKYIPKRKLSRYLLYFQVCSLLGLAMGPLVSIPVLYLKNFGYGNSFFNEYTNSSWLVCFLSIWILFFSFFSYSEPLDQKFSIYSVESSPSDYECSRTGSINSNLQIKKDSNMIEELDERLSQINEENKFSDTNLVSKSIEQMAWKEKKTVSYVYKSFIIFALILFVVRITFESLLIVSPYYVQELDNSFDAKYSALLIGLSLLLVIPLGMAYGNYFSHRFKDRRLMVALLILCIVFNILILNIFYTSLIQYCFMFVFLIISSTLLENMASSMFSKIIPSDYELLGVTAGVGIQILTTLGRIIGALMLTAAGFASDDDLNRITFGVTLFLFICALIIVIFFYSQLRVKAIARIMRGRAMRKLKVTEF